MKNKLEKFYLNRKRRSARAMMIVIPWFIVSSLYQLWVNSSEFSPFSDYENQLDSIFIVTLFILTRLIWDSKRRSIKVIKIAIPWFIVSLLYQLWKNGSEFFSFFTYDIRLGFIFALVFFILIFLFGGEVNEHEN